MRANCDERKMDICALNRIWNAISFILIMAEVAVSAF